jgi:hypothetical protein
MYGPVEISDFALQEVDAFGGAADPENTVPEEGACRGGDLQ